MKIAEVSADQAQAALAGSSGIEEAADLLLANVASDGPPSKREMKKKKVPILKYEIKVGILNSENEGTDPKIRTEGTDPKVRK